MNITKEQMAGLLCSAFEGGSNYWYVIREYQEPTGEVYRSDKERVYPHIDYPLSPGGAVFIEDVEDMENNVGKKYRVDFNALCKGAEIMLKNFPKHYADILHGNDDATTADVFLQCAVFGDVIYG